MSLLGYGTETPPQFCQDCVQIIISGGVMLMAVSADRCVAKNQISSATNISDGAKCAKK